MIVYPDGSIYGTVGGGSLEKKVISQALEVIASRQMNRTSHQLVNQLGMCCGGTVEILIEPVLNKVDLYIFGAGHVGMALAKYASDFDFRVTVIDQRPEYTEDVEIPGIVINCSHHSDALLQLAFSEQTFVVIVTHDHAIDREILDITLTRPHHYIGMIGSERKVAIAKKNLEGSGRFSSEQLDSVDMPIGIEMLAITPNEIAISILAKLIDQKNKLFNKH